MPLEILFTREIIKETKTGKKKMIMLLGVVGFYNKDETVDVQFQRDGNIDVVAVADGNTGAAGDTERFGCGRIGFFMRFAYAGGVKGDQDGEEIQYAKRL